MSRSEDIVAKLRRLEGGGLRTFAEDPPLVWEKAQGCHVEDADGKRYLDLYGGYAVAAIGYSHPKVVEAVQRQASEMMHCPSAHPSRVRAEFYEALASSRHLASTASCQPLRGRWPTKWQSSLPVRTNRRGRSSVSWAAISVGLSVLSASPARRDTVRRSAFRLEVPSSPFPIRCAWEQRRPILPWMLLSAWSRATSPRSRRSSWSQFREMAAS